MIVAEITGTLPCDEDLVARVAAGDQEAFRTLYDRHRERIFHVAFRVTGNADDAEELMQETFLTLHQEAATFEGRAKLTTWLTRIVLNKSINQSKQRQGRMGLLRRWFGKPQHAGPAPQTDAAQVLLDRVAPHHRAVLTLRYVQGHSYQEIARILDCPLGTAKSKLFQAHLALRESLGGKGTEA